jgi:hypothetical protein
MVTPTPAAAIARDHDAPTIARALFAWLDEHERGGDQNQITIERALREADVKPQKAVPAPPRPSGRAGRYQPGRGLGSGGIQEIGDEEGLSETHNGETLGAALIVKLRSQGHEEAATAVAGALQAMRVNVG